MIGHNDPRWKTSSASALRWKRTAGWADDAQYMPLGEHSSFHNPAVWLGSAMFRKALAGGPLVHSAAFEGNLRSDPKQLVSTLCELTGVRPIRQTHGSQGNLSLLLGSDTTMLNLQTAQAGKFGTLTLETIDEAILDKVAKVAGGVLVPDDPDDGSVLGLAKGPMGYYLSRIGTAGADLERGNYDENVMEAYDHVVADLNTPSPCGRLTIFAGVPGSGKTYMVRSLLKAAKHTAFVLVPSFLVKEMGSPDILPTLANVKNDGFKGPIALLLEDADQALVNREKGDLGAISSLLNLSDGILGNMLDIRLIATTNAAKLDMDPATRRQGRLCKYIEVNHLQPVKAASVLARLTGKTFAVKKPMTLAECYSIARKNGWVPPVVQPKQLNRPELL